MMLAFLADRAFLSFFFYCSFLLLTLLIIAFSVRFSGARIKGEQVVQKRSEAVLFIASSLIVLLALAGITWYCGQYSWRDFF